MTAGTRKAGDFCWINMLTPQPEAARDFFSRLLGWTYRDLPSMGHAVMVGEHRIGGLFDLGDPRTPPGTPPLIGVMVKVDSADAVRDRVITLGGKAKAPFDIADQGRMAVCTDPNGGEFDLWEPRKGPGTDVDSRQPGAPSWFETLTTDVERATTFYSSLFGWTSDTAAVAGIDYTTFSLHGAPVAGLMRITPQMSVSRAHWGVYFTVTDTDKTARDAVKLGGAICVPAQDIPGIGRFGGIASPQGVPFYVIAYSS